MHGKRTQAIELFRGKIEGSLSLTNATFVGVLNACMVL